MNTILHISFIILSISTMNTLTPVQELEYIYPDIEGQLCTRHSSTLSRLKQVFTDIYSHEPTHCAIVNGIACLTPPKSVGMSITYALENGVMIYYRRTQAEEDVYINSNRTENEMILDNKGQIKNGQEWELSQKMRHIFKIATEDLSFSKVYGGIFYIHSNLPEGCFKEQETWLTAFFLAVTHLNRVLQEYSLKELVRKMEQTGLLGSKIDIQNRIYNYLNRQLCIRVDSMVATVSVPKDIKLLYYTLKTQLGTQQTNNSINKQQLMGLLQKHLKTTDLLQIYENVGNYNLSVLPKIYEEMIRQEAKIFRIMGSCTCGKQFNELMSEISNLNTLFQCESQQNNINKCPQVQELTTSLSTHNYFIMQDQKSAKNHIVFATNRTRYTDVIQIIRQRVSPKKNKSKDILQSGRWDNKVPSNEQIFSGVPSRGLAILDPAGTMWFND